MRAWEGTFLVSALLGLVVYLMARRAGNTDKGCCI
ncbi:hypothetical protein V6Z11_D08G190000 [Gossypium hirsutum]